MKILLVWTHPVPESYSAALRDSVLESLRSLDGTEVELLDLYTSGFDPKAPEVPISNNAVQEAPHPSPDTTSSTSPTQPAEPSDSPTQSTPAPSSVTSEHRQMLLAANALVFVHPTWWDGLPAMLKAWLEHLLPDALDNDEAQDAAREITSHITDIVAITTHGSSRRVNFVQGRAGRLLLLKSLRSLCHYSCRTKWIALYSIDRASHQKRQKFLTQAASQASKHFSSAKGNL